MASVYNQQDPNQDAYENNIATNIFQNMTGQQQGAGGQQIQAGNAGGDMSQAVGGPQGSGAPKAQGSGDTSANSSKEVIRRNAGKSQSPIDLNQMSQNIKQSKDDLQNEANAYVDTQSKNNYGVANDMIHNALTGDDTSYQSTAGRLQQARPEYQQFAQKTNTDYASKINDLSDASLRQYFKNQAGAMGTAGEAAFDSMLLGQNNQFKQDRSKVQNEAIGLQGDTKNINDKTNADAKAAYENSYDTETNRIKQQIASEVDPLRQQAEAQAAAENAKRQQMAGMGLSDLYNTADYKNWINNIAMQLGQSDYEDNYLKEMVSQGLGLAPRSSDGSLSIAGTVSPLADYNFINVNRTPVSANNYLDAATADELNRGYGLLGTGQSFNAAGGPGSTYTFDQARAQDFLGKQLQSKRDSDAAEAKRIADENAAAENARQMLIAKGMTDAAAREQLRKWGRVPSPDEINAYNPFAPGADLGPGRHTAVGETVAYGNQLGQKAYNEGGKAWEVTKSNLGLPSSAPAACFILGTRFQMADGTTKEIQDIEPGDVMEAGGEVKALGVFRAPAIYELNGVKVSGTHAVLHGGRWQRVKDVEKASRMPHLDGSKVYVVWNEKHRMISAEGTVWADYAETDHSEAEMEASRNIELLNQELQ